MENNWMKIIEERIKRSDESPLTCYSLIYHRNQKVHMNTAQKVVPVDISDNLRIPIVHRYSAAVHHNMNTENPISNARNVDIYVPNFNCLKDKNKEGVNVPLFKAKHVTSDKRNKWPGILGVMESYEFFSKGIYSPIGCYMLYLLFFITSILFNPVKFNMIYYPIIIFN